MTTAGFNWRGIRTVVRKDLTVVFRSKMIVLPMILLPVILQVLMPAGIGLAVVFGGDSFASSTASDLQMMLRAIPPAIMDRWQGLSPAELFLMLALVYMFAPLYLIIPMMVSSVIAADSFVGERERKTLEALLHTPLTDRELLLAKMLSAWMAAVAVGLGAFVLYTVVVNAVAWPVMGRVFFPNWLWIILVLWVSPGVAGMGLAMTVLISTRVNTFQEAYQMGGIVVLPIVALVLGQAAGVIFLSDWLAVGLGLAVWVIDGLLLWVGAKTFDRDALLARL